MRFHETDNVPEYLSYFLIGSNERYCIHINVVLIKINVIKTVKIKILAISITSLRNFY